MFIRLPATGSHEKKIKSRERTWVNHFYDLGIFGYWNLAKLWALKDKKASKWVEGRKNWYEEVISVSDLWEDKQRIWFQCASLGEFEQARPVIEGLKKEKPELIVILTFYSPSGFEVRKNYSHADFVCYLPFDFRFDMELFVELIKPQVAVFTKYDFWLNAFESIRNNNIPLVCLSVHLNATRVLKWPLRTFYRKIFDCVHVLFAQDKETVLAVKALKPSLTALLTGDTRIDRVLTLAQTHAPDPFISSWKGERSLFIIGSAWPEDIAVLATWINQVGQNICLLIAPHEIDKEKIEFLMKPVSEGWNLYSSGDTSSKIIVLDSMGQLANLYGQADFVWIGGAFKQGLHNILEPAVFGVPVFFGPDFSKFQEANNLVELNLAFSCSTVETFQQQLSEVQRRLPEIEIGLQTYFQKQQGASQIAIEKLVEMLNKKGP